MTERYPVVVIGGGQAGLATGYFLARRGISFVILDAHQRVGDSWRRRWDSLRLFSPARYDGLPGMRFPAGVRTYPNKDQMGDYLEQYAAHFRLPVRSGMEVESLRKWGDRFVITAGGRRFEAEQVVVATGSYNRPRVPEFAARLDPGILQLHSSEYRNPSQLNPGPVLIVGAGNSGAEIAMEVVRRHRVTLSGREVGQVPFRIQSLAGRHLLVHLIRFLGHRVLTIDTPMGRKIRPRLLHAAHPLIRVLSQDLRAAGVERAPRVKGVQNGRPELEDGRVLDVRNVIWCTGFHPGFSWIDLPVFDAAGDPMHERGIVASQPGLYFVGLQFLYSMTSGLVNGVGRDAEWIARAIAARITQVPAEPATGAERALAMRANDRGYAYEESRP